MYRYEEMTWPEAKERIPAAKGVIIALGSVEQHGPHLPLGTDMYMGAEVAFRVGRLTECLVLPAIPFGQVWSAKDFPGTISLSHETLCSVLVDVSLSLHTHGARNIVMITGHSGNAGVMKDAARVLYDTYGIKRVYYYAYPDKKKLAEGIMESPFWNGRLMHSGEMETSMMLAAQPDKVHMERAVREYPEAPAALDFQAIPWSRYSKTGVFGDATLATKEKGELYLERVVRRIADSVNEILEEG